MTSNLKKKKNTLWQCELIFVRQNLGHCFDHMTGRELGGMLRYFDIFCQRLMLDLQCQGVSLSENVQHTVSQFCIDL